MTKIRFATVAAAACLAAVALSACASFSPADLTNATNALAAAGCSGTVEDTFTGQTAAGVSPGSLSVTHKFTGSCDPSKGKLATGSVAVGATVGGPTPAPPAAPATSNP